MILDVNVSFGHWPFQKFQQDTVAKLRKCLIEEDISSALVSPIDSIFYQDPNWGNEFLLSRLKRCPDLIGVGVVNPSLSNWQKTLDKCIHYWKVKAIKIFPNYHNYSLALSPIDEFLAKLSKDKILLIIQTRLEDERNQYPLLKVKGVSVEEIVELANSFPKFPILCLCPYFEEAVSLTNGAPNIYVDISFTETLNTVESLIEKIPANRVVFGSHTPFLYTHSAVMKIKSANISKRERKAIMFANARQMIEKMQK